MAAYIDEDFADLIIQETEFDWDDLKKDLPRYPAAVLIEIMTELGLYVNKKLAQEIAKRDDAVFYLRKLLQDGNTGAVAVLEMVGLLSMPYIYFLLSTIMNHLSFCWILFDIMKMI